MTNQDPIRLLDELAAEFGRVAAAEQERQPGALARLRRWAPYPGARMRAAAITLVALMAMSGIAYAIPTTRTLLGDVVGWVHSDTDAGGRDSEVREHIVDPDDGDAESPEPQPPTTGGDSGADDSNSGDDSDSGDEAYDDPEGRAGPDFNPEPGSEEEKAYIAVDGLYDALERADRNWGEEVVANSDRAIGKSVRDICRMQSKAALKQIQDTSKFLDENPEVACLQSLGVHFGNAIRDGQAAPSENPLVLAIERTEDKATVTLKFPNGDTRPIPMVLEDGSWKFDAMPESGD